MITLAIRSGLYRTLFLLPVLGLLAGCSEQGGQGMSAGQEQAASKSKTAAAGADLVILGGRMLDMTGDEPEPAVIKGMVVRGGLIDAILPLSSDRELPPAARTIDAGNAWLVPGLIDAHVHFRPYFPDASIWRRNLLHYGTTSVMDTGPCGDNCPVADPNEWIVAYGDLVNGYPASEAPTLYYSGMKVDGPDSPVQTHAYKLNSLEEIPQYVDYLAGIGSRALKAEAGLNPEYRQRLIEAGNRHGLPTVGHSKDAYESIEAGMKFMEHLYPIAHSLADEPKPDYFNSPRDDYRMDLGRAGDLIQLMVDEGVYLNPTLVGRYAQYSDRAPQYLQEDQRSFELGQPYSDVPPEYQVLLLAEYSIDPELSPTEVKQHREGFAKVQEFLQRFSAAGGKILPSTDGNKDSRQPGIAIHREMQMLVDAGVTPYRALLGATRWSAEMMRMDDRIGTLEEGKEADILILVNNPAEAISNSQAIRYVIHAGEVARAPDDCSVIIPPVSRACWDRSYQP